MVSNKFLWGVVGFLVTLSLGLGVMLHNTYNAKCGVELQNTMLLNNMVVCERDTGTYRISVIEWKAKYNILKEKYDTLMKATQFDRAKSDL